jgi:hypothetical protein
MGQLGLGPIIQRITRGLPLAVRSPDCPDTCLQHHSRHWITSFQSVANIGIVPHILGLSKGFTLDF